MEKMPIFTDPHEIKILQAVQDYGLVNATLPRMIENKANEEQDKIYLYYHHPDIKENISYSFRQVNEHSNRLAHGFLEIINAKLVSKKPKIGVILPTSPEYLFCWFGSVKAGGVFVPLNKFLKGDLLEYILDNCDAEILVIDHQNLESFRKVENKVPKIKKVIVWNAPKNFNYDTKYMSYDELTTSNISNPTTKVKAHHDMEILYTSGTTGRPKGVVYSNLITLVGVAEAVELESWGITKDDVIFCPLPLFHSFGQLLNVLPSLYMGTTLVLCDKFHVSTFWEDIQKYNAKMFTYVGGIMKMLLNQPEREIDKTHGAVLGQGGECPPEVWEEFEKRFNVRIYEGWSLTEAFGITMNKKGSKGGKIGSCGKPTLGTQIKIVDESGNELPPGKDNIGEILSKNNLPIKFSKYYKIPGGIESKFDKDGFAHTGDLGYLDYDGYMYITGRKKDMVRRRGENISAHDIELVANNHPNILESAAFPVRDTELLDEEVKICIVLKNKDISTHQEIYDYLKESMAYFMVPRYIEFVDEFEKTVATEKIIKFPLKVMASTEYTRRKTWDANIQKFIQE